MVEISLEDSVIEMHSKKILLLKQAIEHNILPDPELADVWLVYHTDQWLIRRFLRNVIHSNDIRIYLKPVFLQEEFKKLYTDRSCYLRYLSDGYIEEFDIFRKFPMIDLTERFIQKNIDKRNPADYKTETNFLTQKTFDYYYTRGMVIEPVRESKSLTGYAYPRIEAYFYNKKESFVASRKMLHYAYEHGWLSRRYIDTAHLCKECNSGFLNYRESCPKCDGHDLKARLLIHHFRCAHVGIETDFEREGKLICPKCTAQLRNVGVDYDRPGRVYICNNSKCKHEFQDAPIGVLCIDCGTEQSPDELTVSKKYEYEFTARGIEKGLKGSAGILG